LRLSKKHGFSATQVGALKREEEEEDGIVYLFVWVILIQEWPKPMSATKNQRDSIKFGRETIDSFVVGDLSLVPMWVRCFCRHFLLLPPQSSFVYEFIIRSMIEIP
jgi:hypothetical protein